MFTLQTAGVELHAVRRGELLRSDVSGTEVAHVWGYLQTLGSETLSTNRQTNRQTDRQTN